MDQQTPVILYAIWTLLALTAAGVAASAALANRGLLAGRTAWIFAGAAILLAPAAAAASLQHLEGFGWLLPLAYLQPLLCLLCAWLIFHALHEAPLGARLLGVPVFALDVLLGVAWLLRLTENLTGLDPGLQAGAFGAGYVLLQQSAGHPLAAFLAAPAHLPLLLPPFREWRGTGPWLLLIPAGAAAAGLLLLWALSMPLAWEIASSYRAARPEGDEAEPARPPKVALRLGGTRWGDGCVTAEERQAFRDSGAAGVLLFAAGGILEDDYALRRLAAEGDRVRQGGGEVIVAALPAAGWLREAKGLEELAPRMRALHRRLAETVRPDTLVLWWEPVLLGAERLPGRPHPRAWAEVVAASARELRLPFPHIRLCICMASLRQDGLDLIRLLAAPGFPLDEIGFSLAPFLVPLEGPQSLADQLRRVADIVAAHPGRSWSVLRAGAAPPAVGGEAGQAGVLAHLLRWTGRQPAFRLVAVHSLASHGEDLGLLTPLGRRRQAFAVIQRLAGVR